MRIPSNPPHGPGAGDEPVRGGWGVGTAVLFLSGFVGGVVGLYGVVGTPIPDLGLGRIQGAILAGVVTVVTLATLLFLGWFALAFASPDVDLL